MKVLFIARTYPPTVGGMQRFCSDFYHNYSRVGKIDLVANTGGNIAMLFFMFKLLFVLAFRSRQYDLIHFSDAVLAPMSIVARFFSKAKITFTVHGLDIVYARFGYQRLILPFLKKADKVFAVSRYTLLQCEQRGVPAEKLVVIPNCINFEYFDTSSDHEGLDVISRFNVVTGGKKILLTVGRLIKRKGHEWFLKNVFNRLGQDYIYVIAGTGPEHDSIKQTIIDLDLSDRVYLLGHVAEDEKKRLYQLADLFIMPNVSVEGDQEGFGIVVLEAGGYGLPVIASNMEGIRDAVLDGQTGRLVDEQDVQGFVDAISQPNIEIASLKNLVISTFDCGNIVKMYYDEFNRICNKI